jgi:integrase
MRLAENVNVAFEDIKFNVDAVIVKFHRLKKKHNITEFMITDTKMRATINKYVATFKESDKQEANGRFIRKMSNGKPTKQVIGVNTVSAIPYEIAKFLGKPEQEAKLYTSHSIRRSAATLLAEKGLPLTLLKVAGGWDSSSAAEGYINSSNRMKRTIADAVSSTEPSTAGAPKKQSAEIENGKENITINYHCPNATNCVFNFTLPGPEECKKMGIQQQAETERLILKIPRQF